MPFFRRPVLAILIAASTFACDQAPGPAEDTGHPPVLSDFSFSPNRFAVPADAEGEALSIPLEIAVTVEDVDDDIESVAFVVQPPVAGEDFVADGTLARGAGARFAGETVLSVPAGDLGVYTVLVYAIDRAGSLSNEVRGMLRIEGAGLPPVIESVAAPDTVRRPVAGEPPERIPIVALVSDPDGLANINSVQFWNTANPSARIDMFDTGEAGDETAGDGRYTRVVEIAASNQAGVNDFAFQATDLSGLVSNVIEKRIVVE